VGCEGAAKVVSGMLGRPAVHRRNVQFSMTLVALDPRHVSDVHRADDLSYVHRWPKMPGIQGKCFMRGLMIKPFDDRFYS
jgi:hypothetical protein